MSAAALPVGARVLVAPGQRVPADGIVTAGASAADESMLTGEAAPVDKGAGDAVLGGTVNVGDAALEVGMCCGREELRGGWASLVCEMLGGAVVQAGGPRGEGALGTLLYHVHCLAEAACEEGSRHGCGHGRPGSSANCCVACARWQRRHGPAVATAHCCSRRWRPRRLLRAAPSRGWGGLSRRLQRSAPRWRAPSRALPSTTPPWCWWPPCSSPLCPGPRAPGATRCCCPAAVRKPVFRQLQPRPHRVGPFHVHGYPPLCFHLARPASSSSSEESTRGVRASGCMHSSVARFSG